METGGAGVPSGNHATSTQQRSSFVIITALIVAQFVAADGITCIYVMLPSIYREFPSDASAVGWIVTTYFLIAAMLAAIGGRIADLLGRRTVAIAVLLIAAVGALVGMMARAPETLIAASVLLGATTTLTPILIGLAREHLSAQKVGLGIGAITAAGSAGAGMIFLIVGIIVDAFGRFGGYAFTSIIALFAAALLFAAVPKSPKAEFKFLNVDFLRGILFGPASAGLILSIELAASNGFDVIPLILFAGSMALTIYWVRNQLSQSRPLIDLRLMRVGALPRTFAIMFVLGIAGIQQGQIFSLIFQQETTGGVGFGFSASMAGVMMLPINGAALFVAPAAGILCRRIGAWRVAVAGAAIITITWLLCSFFLTSLVPLLTCAVLSIAGLSLLMPANYLLIVKHTPQYLTSGATGLGFTVFNLGFAAGSKILLTILHGSAHGDGALPDLKDFTIAFYWLAAGSAVMMMLLFLWRDRASENYNG